MDFHKLKHKADFFSALKGLSKKDKIQYVKQCPKEAIETMCEACFNLLKHEKLKKRKKVIQKIKPIHHTVKKLGDKALNISSKRSLLDDSKVVCGIISAIGENILPMLNSMVRKDHLCKNKKKKVTKNKAKRRK